jgi:hypothetical protein
MQRGSQAARLKDLTRRRIMEDFIPNAIELEWLCEPKFGEGDLTTGVRYGAMRAVDAAKFAVVELLGKGKLQRNARLAVRCQSSRNFEPLEGDHAIDISAWIECRNGQVVHASSIDPRVEDTFLGLLPTKEGLWRFRELGTRRTDYVTEVRKNSQGKLVCHPQLDCNEGRPRPLEEFEWGEMLEDSLRAT